jgi:hypothetical protein
MTDITVLDTSGLTRSEAEAIAKEIDPRAGGFFQNCLVRAALMGAQKQVAKLRPKPVTDDADNGNWSGLRERYQDIS